MHERLDARMRLRSWAVASELADVAVGGGEGVLEVEGVPGAAARSLRWNESVAITKRIVHVLVPHALSCNKSSNAID